MQPVNPTKQVDKATPGRNPRPEGVPPGAGKIPKLKTKGNVDAQSLLTFGNK